MPNRRKDYPEYEEELRHEEVVAARTTAMMLDRILVRAEMHRYIHHVPAEKKENQ